MQSRMDRYYDVSTEETTNEYVPSTTMSSRTKRNEELYREVSNLEIEGFDVNSNVSVIGKSKKNIDLDEIRDIIEHKYHEEPKNKSIGLDATQELPEIDLSETREYDINSIIEKAKSTKEVNYEEDRLKKIRNTQYDILKNLNLDLKEEKEDRIEMLDEDTLEMVPVKEEKKAMVSETKDHELLDLINTINIQEKLQDTKELDPLDILTDLKGDNDNTKVLGAMFSDMLEESLDSVDDAVKEVEKAQKSVEETKKKEKDDTEKIEELVKEDKTEKKKDKEFDTAIETTRKIAIENVSKKNKKDDTDEYDDFKDLKDDMKVSRIIVKVLLIMIAIVFIVGCVILANKVFNLGLF